MKRPTGCLQVSCGSFTQPTVNFDGIPKLLEIKSYSPLIINSAGRQLGAPTNFSQNFSYHNLGIPTDLFTPVFAISRMSGWTAHVLEQYGNNRLIRPRAEYVGPRHVPYTPLDER